MAQGVNVVAERVLDYGPVGNVVVGRHWTMAQGVNNSR